MVKHGNCQLRCTHCGFSFEHNCKIDDNTRLRTIIEESCEHFAFKIENFTLNSPDYQGDEIYYKVYILCSSCNHEKIYEGQAKGFGVFQNSWYPECCDSIFMVSIKLTPNTGPDVIKGIAPFLNNLFSN